MSVEIINGSRTSFGPRAVEAALPYAVHVAGVRKQLILPVKFNDLAVHVEGDATGASIPANALITAVYSLPSTTTFVGGTSYAINLVEDDGSAINTVVSSATLAAMNTGAAQTVADATVGAVGPAYVQVVATGVFTAGEGVVVIEYIDQIV